MNINRRHLHQKGLSLVELMIAITLSLVLILGVIQIFSSTKQSNRTQNALGGLQENARFALDTLSYDLRMAGNIGCNRSAVVNNQATTASLPNIGNGIQGYSLPATAPSPAVPVVLINGSTANPSSANIVGDTDAIVVRYASTNTLKITNAATTTTGTPAVTTSSITLATQLPPLDESAIATGDPLIISDCQGADIFIANVTSRTAINLTAGTTLSRSYDQKAEVTPLKYVAYYIRVGDNGIKNLYRSETNGVSGVLSIQSEPLLEGVEKMKILYGEELAGGNIRYVPAGTAGLDMERVVSVRISLLFTTVDNNLASGDQNYWLNGEKTTVALADTNAKKLYRGFTTTIKLRNKGLGI